MSSSEDGATTAKYRDILESNGILDPVAEVLVENLSLKIQGGCSERQYVTVKFQNPSIPPLNLFTKVEVTGNPSHMRMTRRLQAFEKETAFLTKYVPAAQDFLRKKGLEVQYFTNMYPRCYYGDSGMLVMENLVKDKGYEIVGLTERHDWSTAKIVLETLAKHHALSHAMIQEHGGLEAFSKTFDPIISDALGHQMWSAMMAGWIHSAAKTNATILDANKSVEGAPEALKTLRMLEVKKESLAELWRSSWDVEECEFQVLIHGDAWYSNMMFSKDPETGTIQNLKLLDFQILRYNSPVMDLSYYLFTSVRTDVRQSRFQDLVQHYLQSLEKLSVELGHPINLECETLMKRFHQKYNLGLINSFLTQYGAYSDIGKSGEGDITKVELTELGAHWDKLTQKWIAENPEKSRELTVELVLLMQEVAKLEDWK